MLKDKHQQEQVLNTTSSNWRVVFQCCPYEGIFGPVIYRGGSAMNNARLRAAALIQLVQAPKRKKRIIRRKPSTRLQCDSLCIFSRVR